MAECILKRLTLDIEAGAVAEEVLDSVLTIAVVLYRKVSDSGE